jgi:putative glutamine amidotransferase
MFLGGCEKAMKPTIGITPSAQTDDLAHGTFRRYCLNEAYVRAVEAAGGVPIILPPHADPSHIVEVIDGLLLSGGPDVEPSRFGDATIHPMTYGIDQERDQFEIDLFTGARERRLPVLGICRGIQVINVALGGTLIQDVSSESDASREIGHRQHERGLEESAVGHDVHAEHPSLLPIFEGNCLGVNSFHHQAIRDLAPELNAVAYSPDGLIEAVVLREDEAVFAVQWHPELMFQRDPAHLRTFARLVEAAAARQLAPAI